MAILANNMDEGNTDPSGLDSLVEQGTFFKSGGEFDHTLVCKIGAGGAGDESSLAQAVRSMRCSTEEAINKKVKDITKTMIKKEWRSAMARTELSGHTICDGDLGLGDIKGYARHQGATSWVVAVRANSWCYGLAEFSLPGVGAFVTALGTGLWVSGFLVQPLVSQGLAVQDIKAFLETDSGATFAKESSILLYISPGESLWLPYGVAPVVTYQSGKIQALGSSLCAHVGGGLPSHPPPENSLDSHLRCEGRMRRQVRTH